MSFLRKYVCSGRRDAHSEAEVFQSINRPANNSLHIPLVKIGSAKLAVANAASEHVIHRYEYCVRHCQSCTFGPAPNRYPLELSRQVGVLGT